MPDKKLVVIGDGSEIDKIKSKAGKNIEILGYQSNEILQKYMEKAKAFVFAAEEDFGITPVEAQACGTPVIAYGKGGSLETVRPYGVTNPTGVFFDEQTASSLNDAVLKFETIKDQILSVDCRNHAVKFSSERFRNEMADYIESKWNAFNLEKAIVY